MVREWDKKLTGPLERPRIRCKARASISMESIKAITGQSSYARNWDESKATPIASRKCY